jgi:hypothetical protein
VNRNVVCAVAAHRCISESASRRISIASR